MDLSGALAVEFLILKIRFGRRPLYFSKPFCIIAVFHFQEGSQPSADFDFKIEIINSHALQGHVMHPCANCVEIGLNTAEISRFFTNF